MSIFEAVEEEIRTYIFRNTNSDIRFMYDNGCRQTAEEIMRNHNGLNSDENYLNKSDLNYQIEQLIDTIVYLNDSDKINEELSLIDKQVVQRKEINFLNYKLCLKDIPFYRRIKSIQSSGMFLNSLIKNDEFARNIGSTLSNLFYDGKLSHNIALDNTISVVWAKYKNIVTNFYKILWNVLERENRTREWSSPSMAIEEFLKHYKSN